MGGSAQVKKQDQKRETYERSQPLESVLGLQYFRDENHECLELVHDPTLSQALDVLGIQYPLEVDHE
jgi:23S rRNA maturation mini-RNase III